MHGVRLIFGRSTASSIHPIVAWGNNDWLISWLASRLPFYNSNCSKPNGSASPFGEAQLDDTKLRSAAMAVGSRAQRNALPRSAGHSNLDELGDSSEQRTHAGPLDDPAVPAPTPARKTFRQWQRSAWTQSSKLKPFAWNPATEKDSWRLGSPISIMGSRIWSATTSASSVRTISLPPVPLAPTVPRLQLRSFVTGSAFVGTSTSCGTRLPKVPCLGLNSMLSSERVSETPGHLWIPSGIELGETPSISRRKFKIGRFISTLAIHLYWVGSWRGSRRVRSHSILPRWAQAFD